MRALKELRLDLMFNHLHYKQDTEEEQNEATFQDVNAIIAMLNQRNFETLEISFDTLVPEAAGWTDLPFVRIRPQPAKLEEDKTTD